MDEVKALPEGSLNTRYGGETTLRYFALDQYNLQAIDALLAGGADPYMIDYPLTGSGRDFTYYMGAMLYGRHEHVFPARPWRKVQDRSD
ncbi:hypothetical protein [uncultured Bartonella sp.]|uniref:hypothetical protein n=1 Tax=uncultured Bartonella sp. TaxID=104108 RepID=UPI0025E978F1|nr:hypothetical protein [uncultured Bartonella sp.]